MKKAFLVGVSLLLWNSMPVAAQNSWDTEQLQVLEAIERLSASTAPDGAGAGADAYGAVLDDEFSRWTIGSAVINQKRAWEQSIEEWFADGWRVSDRPYRWVSSCSSSGGSCSM